MKHTRLNAVSLTVFFSAMFVVLSFTGSEWRPPDLLAGTWSGRVEVFAPFKKGEYPSTHPEDWIELRVQIRVDGRVDGQIGKAKLVGCQVRKNRGWLGRKLNIKTDYIICGGVLEGRVVPEDTETRRHFTIPFNIVDGKLNGGDVGVMGMTKQNMPETMYWASRCCRVLGNRPVSFCAVWALAARLQAI